MHLLWAQVDREEVPIQQFLAHHVVKDWCGTRFREGEVGKAQDPIPVLIYHEGSLGLAEPKDLMVHGDPSHL